jgi:hypothetical protein
VEQWGKPREIELGTRTWGGELEMEEIQNQIKRSGLRWFGHVKRTDENKIPTVLLEMKTCGRRPRGRPCT